MPKISGRACTRCGSTKNGFHRIPLTDQPLGAAKDHLEWCRKCVNRYGPPHEIPVQEPTSELLKRERKLWKARQEPKRVFKPGTRSTFSLDVRSED